jgi:hypothetical protein
MGRYRITRHAAERQWPVCRPSRHSETCVIIFTNGIVKNAESGRSYKLFGKSVKIFVR